MLHQIHHQFKDGRTEMCEQRDINSYRELIKFADDVKKSHPLPENAMYIFCEEGDKHFWTQEIKP